jgi:hypothetical protein
MVASITSVVGATVCLDVLGTSIAVAPGIAEQLPDLPRTTRPAQVSVTSDSLDIALAELTGLAVERSPMLCVHAGVVAGAGGLIAIPGHSGLGKTTLVAALVSAGFGYISDEALALDRDTGRAHAFARPLALNADVWHLFGARLGAAPPVGSERLVPASLLGRTEPAGGPVAEIVLAERAPGEVVLHPGSRGDAAQVLLEKAFNHYLDPESSFHTVLSVVRGARVWRARYGDAPDLAAELARRFGTR